MIALPDGAARAALATGLQQQAGIAPEFLPWEAQQLQSALDRRAGGLLLLDLALIPALLPVLAPGRFQVIGLTTLRDDPRAGKLAQWGAPTLHLSQVVPFLTQAAPAQEAPTLAPPPALAQPRITVLHSPKGGAGTSTVAAHLSAHWARQGLRVLLVDLSAYGAAAILCKTRQQGAGLEALAATLEMTPTCLEEGLDLSPHLISLLPAPGCLDLLPGARPRMMDRLPPAHIARLMEASARLAYDRIVVDTAAEPTPRTLAALECADQLLLVSTEEYTACWNLICLQELLETLRPKAERLLILNRYTGTGMSPAELQERLRLPLAAVLPADPLLPQAGNLGKPWETGEGSPFAQAASQMAAALHPSAAVSLHG